MSTTTTMLCPKCKGAIVGNGSSFYGRRCTCSNGSSSGAVATMTDPAATATGQKLCCKCGADVTHAKRMKDHLARYWCYECGAADQLKRGSGLALKCPDCNKHFPPTKMLKHGEGYVCESCHTERAKHGSKSGAAIAKVLAALLVIGAGAALIAMYVLDLELLP